MKPLFDQGRFENFGTVQLGPAGETPPLFRIEGRRSPGLLREVRLCCPGQPGVYGMLDAQGFLHYVGKAKDLRKRLLGYFRPRSRAPKEGKILARSRGIVWETWPGEFSALLRELELIRRWRPRSNVQGQPLRRRQAFLCLGRSPAPHAYLSRLPPLDAIETQGPIPFSERARDAVRSLNDHFRLRDCPQPQEMIFAEDQALWQEERPAGCLRLELGTCLGPCTGVCTRTDYRAQVDQARKFLAGTESKILKDLEEAMAAAARECLFERAAFLRDRLQVFRWLHERLERMRQARRSLSFIYPQPGRTGRTWWYFIHAGRPVAAALKPYDRPTAEAAQRLVEEIMIHQRHPGLVDSFEHLDGTFLVTSWFGKRPEERRKTWTADRALAAIRKHLT